MSVNWDWKSKKGEMIFEEVESKKIHIVNIYEANCLGALINEWTDKETQKNMYNFYGWWNDEKHLKNMLGLTPDYKKEGNSYNDGCVELVKVRLNTKYKDYLKIGKAFLQAKINVELYTE